MKTPAFWYQANNPLGFWLAPLGIFYALGTLLRQRGAKPYKASVPVICVGNIVAGGAGKTPTALAVAARLSAAGHRPVFVTRGYGGKLKGPLRVDTTLHHAEDVGDEALLLAKTHPTWIGRDRVAALREAATEATHIILDDGLQNPSLRPDVTLLVIDGARGLGNEYLIPAGPLREKLEPAMHRIDAVIIIGTDQYYIGQRIKKPVLSARLTPIAPNLNRTEKYFAFAGIGYPQKFFDTCRDLALTLIGTRAFPDHHAFSERELRDLVAAAQKENAQLITTEKDFMRLPADFRHQVTALPVKLTLDEVRLDKILGIV